MRSRIALAAVSCLALLAVGCGGGGRGIPPHQLTSTLRSYQPGDQWTYKVTGWLVGGAQATAMSGSLTYEVVSRSFAGVSYLALRHSGVLRGENGLTMPIDATTVISQDPVTGSVSEVGEQDGSSPIRLVTDDPLPVMYPGAWTSSTSAAYTLTYSDGTTSSEALSTTGTAVVATATGTFVTWKVTTTMDHSLYGRTDGTEWWYPALGFPVKIAVHTVYPSGSQSDLTLALTATSIAVP